MLLEDRLDEAYYRNGDTVQGRIRSEEHEVGLEEGFGALPTRGPMVNAPLDSGGQGLGMQRGRPTARKRSTACRGLGGRSIVVRTKMLVSKKATAQKASSAESARREKVAIGIHNWALVGRESARCPGGI
jgi:hypothetical protein